MDLIAIIIGMLLAFALGAYIRAPFAVIRAKEEPAEQAAPTDDEKKMTRQLNNLLNYGRDE